MRDLPWKTALITGASSGLGRGLARWLATRGVKVFAAARREAELRSLAEECAKMGGNVEPVRLDVADTQRTFATIGRIDVGCGGLDLVVANAGIGHETPATKLTWERVEETIQVNVTGAAATVCAALPRMLERNRGQLVGISSLGGFRGMPRSAAYSASKAFLWVFLESLRVDLSGSGSRVRVTTIYPGFVKSELTAKNRFKMPFLLETDEAVERIARAMARGDAELAFPWQMASVTAAARLLPTPLWTAVAARARPSKKGAISGAP
jgi:short-subunit dehydrogenase